MRCNGILHGLAALGIVCLVHGEAAAGLNPALATLGDNSWVKLSPAPTGRYQTPTFTTITPITSANPVQRSYSGAVFGGGKIFYFGGGHASYSGNDVDLYDMGGNVWEDQYTPEPLPSYCAGATSPDPCQIKNGDASGSLSPLGRPWPEHTYQTMTYDPRFNRFLLLRGQGLANNGLFAFSPVTKSWTQLSPAGSAVHGPDHDTMYLTYDPDLQKIFAIVSVGNPGVFQFNESGSNGTWSFYGALAGLPFSGWPQIYGTYDASSKLHLVHVRNIVTGESAFFLYDALRNQWTSLAKPPGMASDVNSFTYDSLNQVVLIAEPNGGAVRVWTLKTTNNGGVGSGTFTLQPLPSLTPTSSNSWLARWSVFGYDPANNVAYFLRIDGVGGGGAGGDPSGFEIWAYRYKKAGGVPIPSLEDERNTYRSWSWSWQISVEPHFTGDAAYTVRDPDIHGDTEGDDLWTYVMMYRRTGQQGYLDRATAWARYFRDDYRQCVGTPSLTYCADRDGFISDHLYGWGLIDWYYLTGDAASLAAAENLGGDLETYYATHSPSRFAYYGIRQGARHLLLATRLVEATGKARWIALRDRLITLWLQSLDWDARGMYFAGDFYTDANLSPGAYAAGARIVPSFHIGILSEAFYRAYLQTGNVELKNRLVAMARFVDQYGMDPTFQYTGNKFGIVNGQIWHNYSNGTTTATFWDPVYTISLVDSLVYGYKLTGDHALYDRAKHFFNRGTKGIYGSTTQRETSDTTVGHFVDTKFDSSSGNFYLYNNRGELQYTYMLFENGGTPTIIGTVTPPPSDTTAPSVPMGLGASPVSSTQINLSWTASTDDVGVAGYRIYRCTGAACAPTASIGTSAPTSFQSTGLTASTSYTYAVAAYDAAGNESAKSTSSTAATPAAPADAQAPTVPANLTATAMSTSEINLSWNASTDNVGVAGYRVYRDGVLVGSPAGTTHTDTGLAAGTTYSYQVEAYDAAANSSPRSSAAATTQSSGGGMSIGGGGCGTIRPGGGAPPSSGGTAVFTMLALLGPLGLSIGRKLRRQLRSSALGSASTTVGHPQPAESLLFPCFLGLSVLIGVVFALSPSALAATYYIDQNHPACNDSNPGTSEAAPWCTLQRAASPLGVDIMAGDTVWVKNGTYSVTSALTPVNSGSVSLPIAFRAYTPLSGPRHRPLITRPGSDPQGGNRPVITADGRDYIVWDGFQLGPWNNAQVYGSVGAKVIGTIFENLIIDKGASTLAGGGTACGNGNYAGLFVQLTSGTIIRNNVIRNISYTDCAAANAEGIVLYDTDNTHIHNNEIYNVNTGILDKENGVSNVHELNYLHDVNGPAVFFEGFVTTRCGSCPVQNNIVRQNIIVNADTGVNLNLGDPANEGNIAVYNNDVVNALKGIIEYTNLSGIRLYNNIVSLGSPPVDYNHISFRLNNGTPVAADFLSDYNNYQAPASPSAGFITSAGWETLSQWQLRSFDLNALTLDPQFVGPLTGTPAPEAFKLASGSPLINAGRVGGLSSGAPVNMGAYITGTEIIGTGAAAPAPDTQAPSILGGLQATAVSSSRIDLVWSASTDNVGVTGYRIYRCTGASCTPTVSIGTSAILSYLNTGLTASTSYTYTVTAYDAAGNESAQSSSSTAATFAASDTQAPTVPANLAAAAVSTTEIDLTWGAATDNVGVTGYRIYRDGGLVATIAGTSFSDTGLAAGTTYSYRVEAYDAAGNSSAQSPAEAATTQSAGGGGQPAASSGGGCGLGMIRPGPPRSGSTGWFLLTLVWPLAVLGGRKIYNCCSA